MSDPNGKDEFTQPSAPVAPRAAFEAIVDGEHAFQAAIALGTEGRDDDAAASYESALAAFRRAREHAPHIAGPHIGMGRTLYALGRFDQSRSSFERALSVDPDNAEAEWGAARALLRLNRSAEAVLRLKRLIALQPGFAPAWLQLVETLQTSGDQRQALEILHSAFERKVEDSAMAAKYGRLLVEFGRLSEAIEAFQRASDLAAADDETDAVLEAKLSMGDALLQAGRGDHALVTFESISARVDDTPDQVAPGLSEAAWYGAGVAAFQLGRYDDALGSFERVRDGKGLVGLYALHAQVALLRGLGEFSEAWTVLSSVESVAKSSLRNGASLTDPEFARVYGYLLRLLGDLPKAIEVYHDALNGDVSPSAEHTILPLHYELIAAYLEQREDATVDENVTRQDSAGYERHIREIRAQALRSARREFKLAEDKYQRALTANRSSRNKIGVAALRMLLGHHARARPLLLDAIKLGERDGVSGPDQELAHAYLGVVYLHTGNDSAAARAFESALQYEPDDLAYQLGAAEAYLRLGRIEVAERLYRTVLDIAPGMVEAHIGLAETLTAQGEKNQPDKYEQAIAEFEEAIRLGISARRGQQREGSTALSNRQLATLHYEIGFVLTRLYEIDTSRESRSRAAPRRLSKAVEAFHRAQDADSSHLQAAQAIERIKRERHEHRSREPLGTWAPRLLIGSIVGLLVFVQLIFFVAPLRNRLPTSFRHELTPTAYGLLVFGLLVFLIAATSLPQLLKLQVAGVALEKAVLEPRLPSQLGISRERVLAAIVSVKPESALNLDKAMPSSEPSSREQFKKPSHGPEVGLRDAKAATGESGTRSAGRDD